MLSRLVSKARKRGVLSQDETDYLRSMVQNSLPATTTRGLVGEKGAPDFQYAALHFSTMIWQAGDAAEDEAKARAGYMLAQFVLSQESPGHDIFWASKLLRELYDEHAESTLDPVEYLVRRVASA